MSGIKGNLRESKQYSKKVGWFEFRPLVFNPDKETLEALLGTTIEKEPEYVDEDEQGNTKVTVIVWGENALPDANGVNEKFQIRFTIIDKVNISEKTGKTQYINSVGDTGWADDESNLQNWFTHFLNKEKAVISEKKFKEALVGEESFYSFLKAWLKMDYFDPETELALDRKDVMGGNFKILNDMIKKEDDRAGTVVVVATIRNVEKDRETKEYQSIYNKAFLPGSYMRSLRVNSSKKPKLIEKFLETIGDQNHGIKDYYIKGELTDYDPSKNVAAGAEVVVKDNDNSY